MILKLSLLLYLLERLLASAQQCKLPPGKEGYCLEKEDCPTSGSAGICGNNYFCCGNSGKAAQHCKEYGKYVYREDYGGAIMARSFIQNVSECAIEAVPLIVGGIKAKTKEFPHMVAIGYGDNIKSAFWMCGGSLISENFVLTAAHCSQSQARGPAKFIRIGALNLKNSDEFGVQNFEIVQRINHPKYKPPSRYYDIALYKLSAGVKMNGYARPACLHATPDEQSYKKATATGWGKLDYNNIEGSPDLMKVSLSLIDSSTCNASFSADIGGKSLTNGVISSQLCAGEMIGGKDTCQGDSGGPIQIVKKDAYCMYGIIGVTSFGKFCGFKNSPAVYTRVSYFIPWIESIVWPS